MFISPHSNYFTHYFSSISAIPNGKQSSQINMYTLVISDGFLCPIWTILTEHNFANFISFWLKEWLRLGGSVPNELCADMSLALLNAVVTAFTSYNSLSDYIDTLFSMNFYDEERSTTPIFECFVRIDIAHLLKNVATCAAFANKNPKVRETYIRCVALLVKATDIKEATLIVKCILIMAYTKSEGTLILLLTFCYW